ncbi:MAG: adenylate/guanylate cyclase domain-containing protein [Rhodobacteraceae bacterium]|nr:adenylate/guanylate cyclase domain-containing protein [Paracoccaceae bacterium]
MWTLRRVRLISGLVLFSYVTLHLGNLSLGLAGIEAMSAMGDAVGRVISAPPVLALLYGSLAAHVALAFHSLYRRRRLVMPLTEAAQLVMGLAIPVLLALHVVAIRGFGELYDVNYNYRLLQAYFWTDGRTTALQQLVGLGAAWLHGCLGVYFWLRLKPWFDSWRGVLAAGAVALPVAGLAGFVSSGREVLLRIATDPDWFGQALAPLSGLSQAQLAGINTVSMQVAIGYGVAVLAVLAARAIRLRVERRAGQFLVRYTGGRSIRANKGASILDVSRDHGVPHAAVCGGRGRCSTCRVQVVAADGALSPPDAEEQAVLARVKAGPGVRLACQLRPQADVNVTLLVTPSAGPGLARRAADLRAGEERVISILFADLRGFTSLTEEKLPYDVVFLLNRYAREMGAAIEAAGGRVDKFMGDGVMALFGVDSTPEVGARAAIEAAEEMQARMARINGDMQADLPAPLRLGIGIHAGRVIVGEIGHGRSSGLTAVGDVVNTASRLEAATKQYGARLIVSQDVIDLAGIAADGAELHQIDVRGRAQPVQILVFPRKDDTG